MVVVPNPAPGLGYGGAEYGYSPYGSWAEPRQPYIVTGGYGGRAYGYNSYGSLDIDPPRVSSAMSVDGYRVEVFFSESMRVDASLLDPASYSLSPMLGALSTVTAVEVGIAVGAAASSVIVTHTGTTLGGQYEIEIAETVVDVVGNAILATARTATFYAIGEAPEFTATPVDGTHVELTFTDDVLTESDFTPGVESVASYNMETTYPVALVVTSVEHPYLADASRVLLTVEGMTSAVYDVTVSAATAIVYDGSVIPDVADGFTGSVVGTGSSVPSGSGLLLTKAAGVSYGWDFSDSSGKLLPSSTYRVDVQIDPSAAVYAPSLYDAILGTMVVSDGAVQITVTFTRVAGVDVVEVSSGIFFAQLPVAWSVGEVTATLVRNQMADIYTLLIDGVPVTSSLTANFTGVPTIAPGIRFLLGPAYDVTQFPISRVDVTSSQTVFSTSWNFLHGVTYSFTGSSALTRPSILTRRGPLVKDWGNPIPATTSDVAIRVNGTTVSILSVNPYLGQITPTIPIPLTTAGSTSVDVDYTWFPNPVFSMAGLNTPGLVLNKWDLHQGWHPPAESPLPLGSVGVPDRQRFPMGIVIWPIEHQRPILIGHRYMGFQKSYTAALNSPTTLLLNQNPHRISRDTLSLTPSDVEVSFEGIQTPIESIPSWTINGVDAGHVGTGSDAGYYVLKDDESAAFGVGVAAFYGREEDLSLPATVNIAVRMQVTNWVADRVFTGLGFGVHNDKFLFFVGFLEINGVQHVGLLRDATRPYRQAAWTIGPSFAITITSSTTFTTSSSVFASTIVRERGVRFQIFDGSQAGVYTIVACGIDVDGDSATITIDSDNPFPENPARWGNNTATAYLEVVWDSSPVTYRLLATTSTGAARLYVGGFLSGLAITASRVSAFPAQTVLLLPTIGRGSVFWGSLSRTAKNQSLWGFVRYGVTYDQTTSYFQGIVVAAEMSDTPDADANHEWFVTEDFGYGEIDSSGNTLLLKSNVNSANTVLDTTYGYGRLEPFLSIQTLTDVDATFRIDSGILGAGDAQVVVQDGVRAVTFSTILYVEGGSPFRRLVEIPSVSITGIQDPQQDGWSVEGSGIVVDVLELPLELMQEDGANQLFYRDLDATSPDITGGRILETRLQVVSTTNLAVNNGPLFGCAAGPVFRDVAFQFTVGGVQFVSRTSPGAGTWVAIGAQIAFDWDDDAYHTYRIIADPTTDTVVLIIDDVVLTTVALTLFTTGSTEGRAYFGAVASTASTESQVYYESFSVVSLPLASAKRTLGVRVSTSDALDIDGWEIPRTDASTDANSTASAIVEEMDWRSDVHVRVRLDPGWGVTVFRPDLPPPPYYTGDFATQSTEPSAGWINVEYRHLPRAATGRRYGSVQFGALDSRSITQQRWSQVRYRIYTRSDEDFIAPQHMVLNWCNVITSGELLRDTRVEVLDVEAISSTLVSLTPTHIYADRVFNVVVQSIVLNPSDWSFDATTQAIHFNNPLPSDDEIVTVTFAAGRPVTNTYLCSQPLSQSTTLLNEGTPPVPMSQVGTATREEVFGSVLNDPTDVLGSTDFILNDPYRSVQFVDDANHLYEALEFCTVDDSHSTGLISIAYDGPGPDIGWIALELSGTFFSDGLSQPGGPGVWRGSNVARDTVGGFSQTSILLASGGNVVGGHLGPGTAILYPSYPAIPGPDRGAVIRSMTMRMRMSSVITDANDPIVEAALVDEFDLPSNASDNDPPSSPDPLTDPNPSGVGPGNGHGACIVELVDAASTTYSRIGPWGGEVALAVRSQLSGGGYPSSGNGFVLVGGSSLGPGATTTVTTVVAAN